MNKSFFILIFLFNLILHFDIQAQVNLVPNPSFEELDSCNSVFLFSQYGLSDWYSPTSGTSDIYNSCVNISNTNGVPSNFTGWQYAFDGNGYAGLITYYDVIIDGETGWFNNIREYIQVELFNQLIENATYQVGFHVSSADKASTCTGSSIGAHFSENQLLLDPFNEVIEVLPQFEIIELPLDSVSWQMYHGTFLANGDEKFLTIGNFKTDSELMINCEVDSSSIELMSYFYIDKVFVNLIDINYSIDIPNIISPNDDGVNDLLTVEVSGYVDLKIVIFNRWGNEVFSHVGLDFNWEAIDIVEGVYYYHIELKKLDQSIDFKRGFIQLIK